MLRLSSLLLLLPVFSIAQKTDTAELLPVEVKAVRASATAPFAKTNLSRADIEKQNLGQDLPFLLNQTPSVVINSDAGNGVGYTGIRIRGTDATRINVTLNGVPFNDAESMGTFFVDLPDFASSVSSIQIQRGVGTSSNGAGSFGGTINISTNEINRTAYLHSMNSFGSFNTIKNTIKAGTGIINDRFTADLRLSRISSDGYIDRASSDLKSYYFSTAYLGDKTNLRLNIFSGFEKTYQAWYGVSEGNLRTNRTINTAGTARPGSPYENETDNYTQNHYQLFWTQKLSTDLKFNTGLFYVKGAGYYEQYRANQRYSNYGLPNQDAGGTTVSRTDLIRQLWLDNDFYGNIFSLQHQSGGTDLIVGGAWTQYLGNHHGKVIWAQRGMPADNHKWYDNDGTKKDVNIYAKWEQALSSGFIFFTDLQWRSVSHEIEGFRNNPNLSVDRSFSFFNPKAGITYKKNNWIMYGSYSIGHKEPNRSDFEASERQLPLPERLQDIEWGVEYKRNRSSAGANLYYMNYKDQLVLTGKVNDVGAYTRTNIDKSYRLGIEMFAGAAFNSWLQASANLTLSRNKINNFSEFIDDYDAGGQKQINYQQTDISFSPDVVGAATVSFTPVKDFGAELISKYVGRQYLDNTSSESRKLDPFYVQDIRFRYTLPVRLFQPELVFQVNNVFNKKYEPNGYTYSYFANSQLVTENYYFPMAGTNWMVGLNVRL